ncbi:sulfurtransferase TusD [Candidatus Photodesmus katoptron]|uniref:Sulfurtransferase TusD homolog n=1 Tax=Candidatus Photodesmus katoptron Akat1 TaxID=1236703 RepID=S3DHS0_9GAMM|nr:sulfurtransferase tusD [Candidatus Photodesmus katoptron Akat1]KEY90764.1 sulfurtransferase TusD [Candidatus Photodesmus katoptron]
MHDVFFYQNGVLNASSLTAPENDDFDLVLAWQKLAVAHKVKLEVCFSAALRRGIVGKNEAKRYQLSTSNLAKHFEQVGLGTLAEAILIQDRVIQF